MKAIEAASTGCPICSIDSKRVFIAKGYPIFECSACDYRFCDPKMIANDHTARHYSDEYFCGGGAGYQDYLAERELLIRHGEHYGDLLNQYTSPGRVLDVGAAAGFLMKGLSNRGWSVEGCEPNESMAAFARSEFGFKISPGAFENHQSEDLYNVVTMIQVIAHFENIPAALTTASKLTKPGGYWLIESWNFRSLTAKVLGSHWHEYSPPTVLHWFSPNGIERFATEFGMKRVAIGRPKKFLDGAHAKSLLRYRLQGTAIGKAVELLLKLVPDRATIRYPAEDLFWILLQKE